MRFSPVALPPLPIIKRRRRRETGTRIGRVNHIITVPYASERPTFDGAENRRGGVTARDDGAAVIRRSVAVAAYDVGRQRQWASAVRCVGVRRYRRLLAAVFSDQYCA